MDRAQVSKIAKIRMLARLDADAIAAYDAAIARVGVDAVKQKLSEFRSDHVRHLEELNAWLAKLDAGPVAREPALVGSFLKAVTAAGSLLGTEPALISMMGNEGLTNVAYDVALRMEWAPEERALIEKNRRDERRHLAWIRDAAMQRARAPAEEHP